MPVKTKKIHHHTSKKERRSKRFLKVYAPYIPLLLIVGAGLFLSMHGEFKQSRSDVLNYATNTTDDGLLDATNTARQNQNLKPLVFNPLLDKAAQAKAEDMAKRNYWAHVTPDGKEPWYFVDQAGYKYFKAAENLAYGFDTSNGAVSGWMNSASHRANVLDRDLAEVGFGIVNVPSYQNRGPQTIIVAMYGQSTSQITSASPGTKAASMERNVEANIPKEEKDISYLQTLTKGKAPWSSFAVGLLIGSILMFLIFKHTRLLHRTLRRGERFILKHPLLDITLVALLALAAIVSQTSGTIH